MSIHGKLHYVCDKCGGYWTSHFSQNKCVYCMHNAIWSFSKPIAAFEQAAHIKERRAGRLEAMPPDKETAGSSHGYRHS